MVGRQRPGGPVRSRQAVAYLHISRGLGGRLARGQLWRAGPALAFRGRQKWSAASTHVHSSSAFSPIENDF